MPNTPLPSPNPRSPALLHQDTSYAWSTGFGAHPRSKLSMATMLNKGMGCLHSEQVSIPANHPSTNKGTNFVFYGISHLACFHVWMFVCQPPNQPACLPAKQPTCLHAATEPGNLPACQPATHLIAPDHGEFLLGSHFSCQKSQHGQTLNRTRPLGITAWEPLRLPKEPT